MRRLTLRTADSPQGSAPPSPQAPPATAWHGPEPHIVHQKRADDVGLEDNRGAYFTLVVSGRRLFLLMQSSIGGIAS